MKILAAAMFLAWLFLPAASAPAAETKDALAKLQYLSTGVSIEEREETPSGYQAKIVLATPRGHFLADVEVVVRRAGREMRIPGSGPWLLLKGEPGEYEIRASAGEAKGAMKISLPAKGMRTYVIHLREPKPAKKPLN